MLPPTVYHLWNFSLSGLRAYGALILFPVFWMATMVVKTSVEETMSHRIVLLAAGQTPEARDLSRSADISSDNEIALLPA